MKNLSKLFSFSLLFFFAISLNAQFSIGPRAGINLATAGGDDVPDEGIKSVVGLQFGGVIEVPINDLFTIQPELLYFQKGAKSAFEFLGETFESETFLNYLEIPLLAKVKFGDTEGTYFFATAGPSIGFGIGIKTKSNGTSDTGSFSKAELKGLDFSLSLGAGVGLPAGPGTLNIDARYLLGLTSTDNSGADAKVNNRSIGISLAYLFPFGG